MTEEQAFDLAKKARRLHALIGQIERDYAALISAKIVKPIAGLAEFDHLPLFLDLAEEIAGNMKSGCDQILAEFD